MNYKIIDFDRQVDFNTGEGVIFLKISEPGTDSYAWLKCEISSQTWLLTDEDAITHGLRKERDIN